MRLTPPEKGVWSAELQKKYTKTVVGWLKKLEELNQLSDYQCQLEDSWLEGPENEEEERKREAARAQGKTHNRHYQICVKFKKKKRATAYHRDLADTFPGWSRRMDPASKAGSDKLKGYCMKKATRVAGPWTCRRVYLGQDLITPGTMNPFQRDLLKQFNDGDTDPRAFWWFVDRLGGSGKSSFTKYMAHHYPKRVGWCTAHGFVLPVQKRHGIY